MFIELIDGEYTHHINTENIDYINECPQGYCGWTTIHFRGGNIINVHSMSPEDTAEYINKKKQSMLREREIHGE